MDIKWRKKERIPGIRKGVHKGIIELRSLNNYLGFGVFLRYAIPIVYEESSTTISVRIWAVAVFQISRTGALL